jgi:hypothetical protein
MGLIQKMMDNIDKIVRLLEEMLLPGSLGRVMLSATKNKQKKSD